MTSDFERYVADLPPTHRRALSELRDTIRMAIPDVEETIRRGVPAFRFRGRPLASIGNARGHVSLYLMQGQVIRRHARHLAGYDTSNTVVRFDPVQPIPVELVARLVKARAIEIGTLSAEHRRSRGDSIAG